MKPFCFSVDAGHRIHELCHLMEIPFKFLPSWEKKNLIIATSETNKSEALKTPDERLFSLNQVPDQ